MRRKKKLLLNLLKVLIIVALILAIYFLFFKKRKNIDTLETTNQTSGQIELVPVAESTEKVELPSNIQSESSGTNYEPLTEDNNQYLISIIANNEVSILIGSDSEAILPNNSPIIIGAEYTVQGINDTIVSEYDFTVEGYNYPIFLLLSENGTVYYVDIQNAYRTGNFVISGSIDNLPPISTVYISTVEKNGKKQRTAILVDENEQGYEFDLSMIGR